MYLMYVDESGDPGMPPGNPTPTDYFVLSGLVLHELRWHDFLEEFIDFRRQLRNDYGLYMREELHASHLINKPGDLIRIKRHRRLGIVRHFADFLASFSYLNIINVAVDKSGKAPDYEVFNMAWKALIQRFDNTVAHDNFSGPSNPDECCTLYPDYADPKKLTSLVRKMRRWNPVPNQPEHGGGYRNLTLQYVIEDPNYRDSKESYFLQAADLAAYLTYQYHDPNSYFRKKSAVNYFERLETILVKEASRTHDLGIVHL